MNSIILYSDHGDAHEYTTVLCVQQRLEPEFWLDFFFIHNLFSLKLTWMDRTHFDAPENV